MEIKLAAQRLRSVGISSPWEFIGSRVSFGVMTKGAKVIGHGHLSRGEGEYFMEAYTLDNVEFFIYLTVLFKKLCNLSSSSKEVSFFVGK